MTGIFNNQDFSFKLLNFIFIPYLLFVFCFLGFLQKFDLKTTLL